MMHKSKKEKQIKLSVEELRETQCLSRDDYSHKQMPTQA